MANPQTEDGFMKLATGDEQNDVLMALVTGGFSGAEYQCVLLVLRKTWGYKKQSDWISISQFQQYTKKGRTTVLEAIAQLVRKSVLVRKSGLGVRSSYQLNKNFNTWNTVVRKSVLVRKSVPVTSAEKRTQLVRKSVPTKDNTTKEIKENIKEKNLVCTEEQIWKTAVDLRVSKYDVERTYREILRSIDEGDKYKVKNAPMTLTRWVQRGLRQGDIEQISDLEYMGLKHDTPARLKFVAEIAQKRLAQEEEEYANGHKQQV